MATALAELTPSSLLNLPPPENGGSYELSKGELIVVGSAGARHELTKERIITALFAWKSRYQLGKVFSESLFALDHNTARMPDVAIVLKERLNLIPDEDITIPIAPDLAIEVISHSESAFDVETKVSEYLAGGVQEVWQVYTKNRFLRVRRAKTMRDYEFGEVLTSTILPNFEMAVSRFFAD